MQTITAYEFLIRKSILFFLLLFICSLAINGQNTNFSSSVSANIKDSIREADILNEKANKLIDENYGEALQLAIKAAKLSSRLNYNEGWATALYTIGHIHTNYTLNFDKAINCLTQSLKLTDANNRKQAGKILNKLAFIHKRQNNFNKAIEYYNKNLRLARENKEWNEISKINSYLAEIYEAVGNRPLALLHLQQILESEKKRHFVNTDPTFYISIGDYYFMLKQYSMAEKYYLDALNGFEKTNNHRWISFTYYQLARLSLQMGQPKSAIGFANKGLKLAQEYKLIKEISDNHYILTAIYDTLKNYEKAYFHFKAHKTIDDSVFTIGRTKEIARIQAIYDTDVKEEKLARLQMEKELSETKLKKTQIAFFALIGGLLLAVLLTIFLFRNYMVKQRVNNELVNRDELKTLRIDEIIKQLNHETEGHLHTKAKLEVINSELNDFMYKSSHDLKGPLASIIGLTNLAAKDISENERMNYISLISKSTIKLSSILDELLNAVLITRGNLVKEKINLKGFVEDIVEQLKDSDNARDVEIRIELDTTQEINSDKNLLRTIMHNMIENAIKYKRILNNNPYVLISGEKRTSAWDITITDNGQGIPPESHAKVFDMFVRANESSSGSGLGLYLVKKSLDKLGGKISLNSQPEVGTTFEIKIPE